MKPTDTSYPSLHGDPGAATRPTAEVLGMHVLSWLAGAHGVRRVTLEDVARGVQARKSDVRPVLSALHREGFFDVYRGRLTLAGFTLGRSLRGQALPPLRSIATSAAIAAA
jgi:DNA-binding IclR family transcriptional regulator